MGHTGIPSSRIRIKKGLYSSESESTFFDGKEADKDSFITEDFPCDIINPSFNIRVLLVNQDQDIVIRIFSGVPSSPGTEENNIFKPGTQFPT